MAGAADVEPSPAPEIPDFMTDPNAVLKDTAEWRYGRAPDYSNTRNAFEQTKKHSHEAGSLPWLVQNLVKNWEVEASFKSKLSDWRTVDHQKYSFAINGGPPQSAEHMLQVGTYNAILSSNEFYSPATSDFASSHKTFKRMMPTFAWEVVEVYGGPPQVAFKWRHWGYMKNDYVGFNDKGEKVTAKAHGGLIDIEGVTVAVVNEKFQVVKLETWFDPLEMFRQIAPEGIVNKVVVDGAAKNELKGLEAAETNGKTEAEGNHSNGVVDGDHKASEHTQETRPQKPSTKPSADEVLVQMYELLKNFVEARAAGEPLEPRADEPSGKPNGTVRLANGAGQAKTTEETVAESSPPPDLATSGSINGHSHQNKSDLNSDLVPEMTARPGAATAATPASTQTQEAHEEMSTISAANCPFLNKE